jgi:predicted GNAT family N-acyltransferase
MFSQMNADPLTHHLIFREVPHGGPEYLELARLRDLHLRQPIGLRLRESDRIGEEQHRHFLLEEDGEIVGGLIAVPLSPESTKLRQMWIHPDHRGLGHGQQLLESVEKLLVSEGVRHFTLHARQNAADFYSKSGYEVVGDPFTEVGRPHLRMDKFA